LSKWNEGRFPTEPGEHKDLPIFNKAEVLIDNGYGQLIPVALTVSLLVEQHLFFGELPIEKISGFKDELSGAIITNAFTIGILDSQEVWDHWSRIASTDELPREPMITMRGLIAFTPSRKPWLLAIILDGFATALARFIDSPHRYHVHGRVGLPQPRRRIDCVRHLVRQVGIRGAAGIRLDGAGAAHIGQLAMFLLAKHFGADLAEVSIHPRRTVGLWRPTTSTLGAGRAARRAEDRRGVEKLDSKASDVSFE